METIEEKIDRMLMLQARHARRAYMGLTPGRNQAVHQMQAKRWATQRDKLKREILDYIEQLEREVEGGDES